MSTRIPVLAVNNLTPAHREQLSEHFELFYAPKPEQRQAVVAEHGSRIQVALTIGAIEIERELLDAMPALKLVCCLGAGYEMLDLKYLKSRGIAAANGAGCNANCVADHAFALMLSALREVRTMDRACRAGQWRAGMVPPAQASGKKLGIFGMGAIGLNIAKRAQGFDMQVAYCNRKPNSDVPHRYFDQLLDMAAWCDVLVCAAPGGAATRHAVNADVLAALGAKGVLVNIGRGSVVDTVALAQALQDKTIASAALDVYESEPLPPQELISLDNLTITPHIGGWSPEAVQATVDRFIDNVRGYFDGTGLISPIDM